MNNISNIFTEKNNLNSTMELFFSKIQQSDNLTFGLWVETINKLIDSLIDICIKNKITYFINQQISFTSIKYNFKNQLEKMSLTIAKKIYIYIEEHIDIIELADFSDWGELFEIFSQEPKNKVSFNPNATEYQYDEHHKNKKVIKKTKPVKILMDFESENKKLNSMCKIAIYIKVICSSKKNNKFLNELKKLIQSLCVVISEPDIDYDVLNPYNN